MPATEFILKNTEDVDALANRVLEMAIASSAQADMGIKPVVITLQGELGSGKTTFTKALARRLGIAESVTSPTFVILKRYSIPKSAGIPFANLIHVDAYRVESSSDMEKTGLRDFINTSSEKNILCIEWPEIISDILPSRRIEMKFNHVHARNFGDIGTPDEQDWRTVTVEQKV